MPLQKAIQADNVTGEALAAPVQDIFCPVTVGTCAGGMKMIAAAVFSMHLPTEGIPHVPPLVYGQLYEAVRTALRLEKWRFTDQDLGCIVWLKFSNQRNTNILHHRREVASVHPRYADRHS
jgi:hypothetical protein